MVFWLTVLLSAWIILGSKAKLQNSKANGSYTEKQIRPKVQHTDSLPRLDLVARETSGSRQLRRRSVTDIGNVLYSPQ